MATYTVHVREEYWADYEVEADSPEQAEQRYLTDGIEMERDVETRTVVYVREGERS